MLSLLVFILVLSVLIIVHEFGHFAMAKKLKVAVEEFSLGFGHRLFARKKDETEYSIRSLPLGGYVKLAGDNPQEYKGGPNEYLGRPCLERAAIVFCGPLLNYALGFLCFWLIFFAGYPTLTSRVGTVIDGLGAKEAGITAGDKIIAIDSKKVRTWEDLQEIVQGQKTDTQLSVRLVRGSREYDLKVKVKAQEASDLLGAKRKIGLIGVTPHGEAIQVRHGFGKAFLLSAGKTWELTAVTYKALWRLVSGRLSMRESMTGPLGIFYITSQAAKVGLVAVLQLVAVLSISLAIFNLLPLPVLDGGHILLLGIEKIRGKMLGEKTEQVINRVGVTLLITLAVFVTYNDILRFFGDKIAKWFIK